MTRLPTTNYRLLTTIILTPILCLLTYQATKASIAAVQLNNAYYFLGQISQQYFQKDQSKTQNHKSVKTLLKSTQKALSTVGKLTPDDPDYHNLSANLKIWEALINPTQKLVQGKILQQAKKHYLIALKEQPNNPFLWSGLAKTDSSGSPDKYTLNAIKQASHYAPHEKHIQ